MTVKWWKSKELTYSDFNQDSLKNMNCQHKGLSDVAKCDEYWKGLQADTTSIYTPNDFKVGEGTQKLMHYTFVFQIFVFMQLFNIINSRKIFEGEKNVFEGFMRNNLFLAVVIVAFAIQIIMVQSFGRASKTAPMDIAQIGICLAFGSGELIWGFILKHIPKKYFQCYSFDESVKEDDDAG